MQYIENEVLDKNQEDNDLLIENDNNRITNSELTKCNEQNTQENLIEEQSEKNQPKYVTMELFDTFYDDYIEYKHINDILKNFPVSEDVLNGKRETSKCETSCKERTKSLENKMDQHGSKATLGQTTGIEKTKTTTKSIICLSETFMNL